MKSTEERIRLLQLNLDRGLLCKCPYQEITFIGANGGSTRQTLITHKPDCEGLVLARKVVAKK